MGIVSLEGLEFFAYHGFHKEEQKLGNKFTVDIVVEADLTQAASTDHLSDTVDYVKLYEVVKEEMSKPSKLLERIAKNIINHSFRLDSKIKSIQVTVTKYNPPIGGVCHKAKVTLKENRPA